MLATHARQELLSHAACPVVTSAKAMRSDTIHVLPQRAIICCRIFIPWCRQPPCPSGISGCEAAGGAGCLPVTACWLRCVHPTADDRRRAARGNTPAATGVVNWVGEGVKCAANTAGVGGDSRAHVRVRGAAAKAVLCSFVLPCCSSGHGPSCSQLDFLCTGSSTGFWIPEGQTGLVLCTTAVRLYEYCVLYSYSRGIVISPRATARQLLCVLHGACSRH
eukprot:COSAG01_NODE_549_length_15608_cov_206.443355_12_plen_220_part_00